MRINRIHYDDSRFLRTSNFLQFKSNGGLNCLKHLPGNCSYTLYAPVFHFVQSICGYRCAGLHRVHTEAEVIQQSANLLQSYLSDLLHAILQSASYCPVALCQAFQQLYQRVHKRFPEPEYRVRMIEMSILTYVLTLRSKESIWAAFPESIVSLS